MTNFQKRRLSKETKEILEPRGNKECISNFGRSHQWYSQVLLGQKPDYFANFLATLFQPLVDAEMFEQAGIYLETLNHSLQSAIARKEKREKKTRQTTIDAELVNKVTSDADTTIFMIEAAKDDYDKEESRKALRLLDLEMKAIENLRAKLFEHINDLNEQDRTADILEIRKAG